MRRAGWPLQLRRKLTNRALKDQEMIKALDGDKQLLLDQLRAVKRELQADVAEALGVSRFTVYNYLERAEAG